VGGAESCAGPASSAAWVRPPARAWPPGRAAGGPAGEAASLRALRAWGLAGACACVALLNLAIL